MIASVRGHVLQRNHDSVIVSVGGVGLELIATRAALEMCQVGSEVFLHTRLLVREDALILVAFASSYEREVFDALLKVSGVGAKLAVAILSHMTIDNLRQAVANARPEFLSRVPGVGKKTAEKILIELKDKMPTGLDTLPISATDDLSSDLLDALTALGFSVIEAQTAIQSLPPSAPKDVQERLRLCLQYLSS